jgi:hypothetical protein
MLQPEDTHQRLDPTNKSIDIVESSHGGVSGMLPLEAVEGSVVGTVLGGAGLDPTVPHGVNRVPWYAVVASG